MPRRFLTYFFLFVLTVLGLTLGGSAHADQIARHEGELGAHLLPRAPA